MTTSLLQPYEGKEMETVNGRRVIGRLYHLLIFIRTIKIAHEQCHPRNLLSY